MDIYLPAKKQLSYLLPNAITTGAMFAGFYAIIAAINGSYSYAAIAIFIAMILDGLDGRIARLTRTSSEFGAQYDSLADVISFGVAPSVVCFSWSLHSFGKLGWALCFVYLAAAALRLARFNSRLNSSIDSSADSKNYFVGLPSPAGAANVMGFVWVVNELDIVLSFFTTIAVGLLIVLISVLMVSNVPYNSFKNLKFKSKMPFFVALIVAVVYAMIAINPAVFLLAIFSLYTLSGPMILVYKKIRKPVL